MTHNKSLLKTHSILTGLRLFSLLVCLLLFSPSFCLLLWLTWFSKLKSKSNLCYDRQSFGQSILVSSTHLWLKTRLFFLSDSCRFIDVETSLLMKGWVCRLQLLLVRSSAVVLVSESSWTHNHILLSHVRDSPNLEDQVPVFIYPRNRVAQV
jgi:hypothetical protein